MTSLANPDARAPDPSTVAQEVAAAQSASIAEERNVAPRGSTTTEGLADPLPTESGSFGVLEVDVGILGVLTLKTVLHTY